MADWQVTGTTIYCDAVDDEVTIVARKDQVLDCIGYRKYGKPDKDISNVLKKRGKRLGRKLKCLGPKCGRVAQYEDKLLSRESGIHTQS